MQTQANEPLISGKDQGQATKSVHTYSPDWALQGDGYQPVSYGSPKFQCVSMELERVGTAHPRPSCVRVAFGTPSRRKREALMFATRGPLA